MKLEYLLVTDLDGTLLGDDAALQAFRLRRKLLPVRMRLAYASGRLVEDVRTLVLERDLCLPDAIIGGVGTQIECFDGAPTDWCRPAPGAWRAALVRALLADIESQPDCFQTEFKVSFYLPDASPVELALLSERLARAGIEADLIYSSQRDLDVVPRGVNKGTAARYLADRWRIPAHRVIVCGDSGNDLSLFQSRFRGVVVANCMPELRQLNGTNIFCATMKHAAGVLEGVDYWLAQEAID
jgi:mannosylfructose-6-phosphate phosphatase